MEKHEMTVSAPRTAKTTESQPYRRSLLRLSQKDYDVGGTHVFCWLSEADISAPDEDRISSSVQGVAEVSIYSAPCGLMRIVLPDHDTAREVFSLLTRYEVSPYHVEDILEDREINATLYFL